MQDRRSGTQHGWRRGPIAGRRLFKHTRLAMTLPDQSVARSLVPVTSIGQSPWRSGMFVVLRDAEVFQLCFWLLLSVLQEGLCAL